MQSLRSGILVTAASLLLFGGLAFAQMNAPAGGETKSTTTACQPRTGTSWIRPPKAAWRK